MDITFDDQWFVKQFPIHVFCFFSSFSGTIRLYNLKYWFACEKHSTTFRKELIQERCLCIFHVIAFTRLQIVLFRTTFIQIFIIKVKKSHKIIVFMFNVNIKYINDDMLCIYSQCVFFFFFWCKMNANLWYLWYNLHIMYISLGFTCSY